MPHTIYYRTFPLFKKEGAFPSPNSVWIEAKVDGNAKRKMARMEPISLGPLAKIPKLQEETTIARRTESAAPPWICTPSIKASRTGREKTMQQIIKPIIEEIKPGCQRGDNKEPISLASADGTMSHIPPCSQGMEAIVRAVLRKPRTAQYSHASGSLEARSAIASHHSVPGHPPVRSESDVIVTNGCSGALEISLMSLLDPGTSLLVPKPGFPLYEEIAESLGATVVEYDLDPDHNWECNLDHLEAIMKDASNKQNVRAMVINNPSSHGAVFSERHLLKVLDFAMKHRLPIVSDEVYGDLTFGSNVFHPLGSVAAKHGSTVPVITTSGLSKQFLVPGWRLGWVVFHDNQWGSLKEVRAGAHKLASLRHGLSHLQQSAIRGLLLPSPTANSSTSSGVSGWKENLRATLEHQANLLYSDLEECDGLDVRWTPQGSMYGLVGLNLDRFSDPSGIRNDVDFCRALVRDENVFCLPGSSFGIPGTIRVAFAARATTLGEASQRITRFCRRHTTMRIQDVREEERDS